RAAIGSFARRCRSARSYSTRSRAIPSAGGAKREMDMVRNTLAGSANEGMVVCVLFCSALAGPALTAEPRGELRDLGTRYTENAAGDVIGIDLARAWVTDADLERLARLPQLETINLAYTKITDEGLEYLAPLKNVRVLDLYYAEAVTDLGIA